MKRYLNTLLLLSTLVFACKKGEQPETPVTTPPVVPPIVKPGGSSKTFKIDSIKSVVRKNDFYKLISDSVWADSTGISFKVQVNDNIPETALYFPNTNNATVYPGSVLQKNSIEDLSYKPFTPVGSKQKPLVIFSSATSFIPSMTTIVPSAAGTENFIKTAFKGKGSDDFSYANGSEFNNYSEITMAQRINWDFSSLVIHKHGDKGQIKRKTGFYVGYRLSLFNLTVDLQASGDGQMFEPALTTGDPIFVSQVVYGRTAIIAVESDATFQQIRQCFMNVKSGKETADDKKILQDAIITTYMRGFKTDDISNIQTAKGYDKVNLFTKALIAGGAYSVADYGVPINFCVNKIEDNQPVVFRFNYRLDFSIL